MHCPAIRLVFLLAVPLGFLAQERAAKAGLADLGKVAAVAFCSDLLTFDLTAVGAKAQIESVSAVPASRSGISRR
jgi:hypothetical protein